MGQLTTHVLDTAAGRPASGLIIELWAQREGQWCQLRQVQTNDDGRVDGPILQGEELIAGQYELRFHAGAYHQTIGVAQTSPPFLDVVPVRFGIADADSHYHVPLLLSPYGYSTYRGS